VCDIKLQDELQFRRHKNSKRHKILQKQYGKYKSVEEKQLKYQESVFIEAYAIGNEFGLTEQHSHTHAVFRTKEKMTFEEFKIKFSENISKKIKLSDVERARNLKASIRYVTKEDPNSLIMGFDKSMGGVLYKAGQYAKYHNKVQWSDPQAATIALCDRKSFESYVNLQNLAKQKDELRETLDAWDLKPWQDEITTYIKQHQGNDRQVIWLSDVVGNSGKSYLAKYLTLNHGAIVFNHTIENAVSFAYNEEPLVIFDFTRSTHLDQISYNCIEQLKNGNLFSTKYESRVKLFQPPTVVCFSNTLPPKNKLSLDRWIVFDLSDKEELVRLTCFNTTTPCTDNTHICNNK